MKFEDLEELDFVWYTPSSDPASRVPARITRVERGLYKMEELSPQPRTHTIDVRNQLDILGRLSRCTREEAVLYRHKRLRELYDERDRRQEYFVDATRRCKEFKNRSDDLLMD